MIKNEINTLLEKEMDRKGFLKHVAVGFVAITGVAALVKNLNSIGTTSGRKVSSGYGSSAYGGTNDSKPAPALKS